MPILRFAGYGSSLLFTAALFVATVDAHGNMVRPTPRQPEPMYWYQVGCLIGCTCSGSGKETYPSPASLDCPNPGTPTLTNAIDLTWNVDKASPRGEWNKYMPWRAPGTSIPLDSCGIASGFLPSATVQYPHTFKDTSINQGTKGTTLKLGPVTYWEPGEEVDVSFHLAVNHGGGYQYRVCPATSPSIDEACFEAHPLKFASTNHVVVMNGKTIDVLAHDVVSGVRPAGHAWRKLPLPACNCDLGASCSLSSSTKTNDTVAYTNGTKYGSCEHGLQFDAAHLHDGSWPEGFGYYVDVLGPQGSTAGEKGKKKTSGCYSKTDQTSCTADSSCGWATKSGKTYCVSICDSLTGQSACDANSKCQWYSGKGVCGKAADVCGALVSKVKCEGQPGCAWYTQKSQCYTPQVVDRDAGFGGAKGSEDQRKNGIHQNWEIMDKVIAPSVTGDYLLQWRWDNEQTPQIWTSCADIKVCKGCKPNSVLGGSAKTSLSTPIMISMLFLSWCLWLNHGRGM